jgi:DNA uptake protein ComE-like DNA-binding protein
MDIMRINLATVLRSASRYRLSRDSPRRTPAPVAAAAPSKPALNLSTATLEQLETLPGIGRIR